MSISFIFKYRNFFTNSLNQITKRIAEKFLTFVQKSREIFEYKCPLLNRTDIKDRKYFFSLDEHVFRDCAPTAKTKWVSLVLNYKAILRISFQN